MVIGELTQLALRPKAFLLDLDGTLADTVPALKDAYFQFMKGQRANGSDGEFQSLIGPSLKEIVAILKARYHWLTPAEVLLKQYLQLVHKAYEHCQLLPGALDFLHSCASEQRPVWLVTSAPQELAEAFLSGHQIEGLFQDVVTADHLAHGKPDPAIYYKALELTGLSREAVLAVEDSPRGALSSLNAGIPTVLMLTGPAPESVAQSLANNTNEPLGWVTSWGQLLSLVNPP